MAKQGATPKPRSGSPLVALLILGLTLVGAIATYPGSQRLFSGKENALLASGLAKLPRAYTPLRLLVVSASGGEVRAKVKLLDLSGREVAILEKTFQGPSLALECYAKAYPGKAEAQGVTLLYPRLLRGRGGPENGLLLVDAYDKAGFPGIFDSADQGPASLSPEERKALSSGYGAAKATSKASQASKVLILFSGLEEGRTYEVRVDHGEALLAQVPAF